MPEQWILLPKLDIISLSGKPDYSLMCYVIDMSPILIFFCFSIFLNNRSAWLNQFQLTPYFKTYDVKKRGELYKSFMYRDENLSRIREKVADLALKQMIILLKSAQFSPKMSEKLRFPTKIADFCLDHSHPCM